MATKSGGKGMARVRGEEGQIGEGEGEGVGRGSIKVGKGEGYQIEAVEGQGAISSGGGRVVGSDGACDGIDSDWVTKCSMACLACGQHLGGGVRD